VLTFTTLQFVNKYASLLQLPTDILNLPPDADGLEKRFESNLVQTKDDGEDDDEKRSGQPHGHDDSVGVYFHVGSRSSLPPATCTPITGLGVPLPLSLYHGARFIL